LRGAERSTKLRCVRLRCLIVDDNPDFVDSARRLLASQGLDVVGSASSGVEALAIAEALEPDVALIDVHLGTESGLDVARRLAQRTPATRVVLISTDSEDDLGELLRESPAVAFLPKTALSAAAIADVLP
jgi:two-component system, NarL family, nitrate/nitrite response regulator NarL